MPLKLGTLIGAIWMLAAAHGSAVAQSGGDVAAPRIDEQNQQTTGPGNTDPSDPAAIESPSDQPSPDSVDDDSTTGPYEGESGTGAGSGETGSAEVFTPEPD